MRRRKDEFLEDPAKIREREALRKVYENLVEHIYCLSIIYPLNDFFLNNRFVNHDFDESMLRWIH